VTNFFFTYIKISKAVAEEFFSRSTILTGVSTIAAGIMSRSFGHVHFSCRRKKGSTARVSHVHAGRQAHSGP
jgi:hypothetical protein